MANTKISALTAATSVAGADLAVIVQGGTTKNVPASMISPEVDRTFLPESYGAVGDASTDDTTAIQNCINAAVTWTSTNGIRARVLFTKLYKVTAALTCTVALTFEGLNPHTTGLTTTATTGHILQVAPTSDPAQTTAALHHSGGSILNEPWVKNMGFFTTVTRTSGAAVYIRFSYRAHIENVQIGESLNDYYSQSGALKMKDGILLYAAGLFEVRFVDVNASGTLIEVCGNPSATLTGEVSSNGAIYSSRLYSNGFDANSIGVHYSGSHGGMVVHTTDIGRCHVAVRASSDRTTFAGRELFLGQGCFFDSSRYRGIDIVDGKLSLFSWSGVWIAGTNREPTGTGSSPIANACGAYIGSGVDFSISGGYVYANFVGPALWIKGQGTVTGIKFSRPGTAALENTGDTVLMDSGSVITVSGCDMRSGIASGYNVNVMGSAVSLTLTGNNIANTNGRTVLNATQYLSAGKWTGNLGLSDGVPASLTVLQSNTFPGSGTLSTWDVGGPATVTSLTVDQIGSGWAGFRSTGVFTGTYVMPYLTGTYTVEWTMRALQPAGFTFTNGMAAGITLHHAEPSSAQDYYFPLIVSGGSIKIECQKINNNGGTNTHVPASPVATGIAVDTSGAVSGHEMTFRVVITGGSSPHISCGKVVSGVFTELFNFDDSTPLIGGTAGFKSSTAFSANQGFEISNFRILG